MRTAHVLIHDIFAGELIELDKQHYRFCYDPMYQGPPVSLTMPIYQPVYAWPGQA